eukprot:12916318-Prorocentrum_lima.AAC.1
MPLPYAAIAARCKAPQAVGRRPRQEQQCLTAAAAAANAAAAELPSEACRQPAAVADYANQLNKL